MSEKREQKGGGLSIATLVIASCSSVAAALFIHKFWQGGAILGAAFTPVIVALVSEGLRRPVEAVKTRTTTVNPPPVAPDPGEEQRSAGRREDKFGIWEDQKEARRPRRRIPVKLALATGVVAFLIAAFFMTGAELVLGGASDSDRFRFVPGKQQKKDRSDRDRDAPGQTQPDEQDDPAPEATTPEDAPDETVPQETVPQETVPPETVAPPAQTTPAQPVP